MPIAVGFYYDLKLCINPIFLELHSIYLTQEPRGNYRTHFALAFSA